jgi:hypothetical protein
MMMIGAGVVAAGLLLLIAVLSSGGRPAPATVDPPPSRRTPLPPAAVLPSEDAERLLKDLESFASLAPAAKILARCEELRAKFRGTPQERRFHEIEAAASVQKKETQLSRELDALEKIIDQDPKYDQFEEVVRRLKASRAIAGPRAAEVDRRLAEYESLRRSSPHEKHLGPFAPDDQGFVRNWLILGVFPNEKDQGLDIDFLKGESTHDAVLGLEVGGAKWTSYGSPGLKIDFYAVPSLGIKRSTDNIVAYAACLVQVPGDVAAEFRLGSDDGGALWVDGRQVGKVHKARALKVDEDRYAVPLTPGVHRVLVKVENHARNFEFALRIVTHDGGRVPSLRVWN